MDYQWDFGFILTSWPVYVRGAWMTVKLSAVCLALGGIAGLAIALLQLSKLKAVSRLGIFYVEVFRNIPALIQLIWLYYAVPVLTGLQISPVAAALIGISLNTSAYCAEVYRTGIQSIVNGQWEGGKALGMSHGQLLKRIILPQVFQRMLPALTNRAVEVVKVTSLASVISVAELTYEGRLLSATYFRPMEALTMVAVIYLVLIYPVSFLSARLERRLSRKLI